MIITSATYLISSPDFTSCPPPDRPEYAFIGRSNVGKSSLINILCNNQKLAKISNSPGKTKLINHFKVESIPKSEGPTTQWYLADLPGYGFAKVSISQRKKWEKMIEDYLRKRENLVNVFILIDGRHSPQKIDLEFVNQLGKWQIPFCLVFTKADKETQLVISRNVKDFLTSLRATWQFLPQHFITSAVKKLGRDKMLQYIEELNKEYSHDHP
ncbi:MAG: ribosome biogenesis GTP-binding protein YihA/YsxC [Chitinophagaceae bacterium]